MSYSQKAPLVPRPYASTTRVNTAVAIAESESSVLQKLLTLITSSPHLDGTAVQSHLPLHTTNRHVLGVKGALHERQFQYDAAMHVYVHMLHDPMKAEAFADRLFDIMKVCCAVSCRFFV